MRAVCEMDTPAWVPNNPDDRRIGRVLHVYLSTTHLPDCWWDGTPDGIAEQLYELIELCEELAWIYRRRHKTGSVLEQLDVVAEAALLTANRWRGDHRLLPQGPVRHHDLRSAAVAADLAHFGDLANRVQDVLVRGDAAITRPVPPPCRGRSVTV